MWRRPLSWASRFSARRELWCQSGLLQLVRARLGSPVSAPPGLSLDDRLQRRLHGGAPGQAAGPLLSVPMPHHHELHAYLPQGTACGPAPACASPGRQSPRSPRCGPGGVGTSALCPGSRGRRDGPSGGVSGRVPSGGSQVPALGSAGFALTASTGSRGGCGPPARGLCPTALCPRTLPAALLGALLALLSLLLFPPRGSPCPLPQQLPVS